MEAESLYFTGPRQTEIRSIPVEMGDGEVLVETQVSGISAGTELLVYRDEAPSELSADESIDSLDGDLSYPVRYGYSAVGQVVETGSAVDEAWQGRTVFSFNPHDTRFTASPEELVAVPEDLDGAAMALLPSVETATSLVLDGRPRVGERVVVYGAGVIGLCTIDLLSSFPLETLVAVEPVSSRREKARRFGADVAVPPSAEAEVIADTDAGSSTDPPGADLVFELSGQPASLDDAIDTVGYDGRVVVGSWYGTKRASLDLGTDFHRDRISIESSQVSTLAPETRGRFTHERRMSVALDRLRDLDTDSLLTHRIPFQDADAAYRLLDDEPETALQVLLTYQ